MWNFRIYDEGLDLLEERAAGSAEYKEEVKRVTQALRNDVTYFNCATGHRTSQRVDSIGIAIPEPSESNRGYVFSREESSHPDTTYYSCMMFEATDGNVECTGYAGNLTYDTEHTPRPGHTLPSKCRSYHELLKDFSDTPSEDVQHLLPSFTPPQGAEQAVSQ